jgi:hypothetical protein
VRPRGTKGGWGRSDISSPSRKRQGLNNRFFRSQIARIRQKRSLSKS